jgi:hypothetical protein
VQALAEATQLVDPARQGGAATCVASCFELLHERTSDAVGGDDKPSNGRTSVRGLRSPAFVRNTLLNARAALCSP